jgi:uncharacterized membrane protein YcaP (DUF421 family)
METVVRPLVLYFALLVVMRVAGKRALGEVTAFDFVLLLIVSETVSDAIVGSDNSLTAAIVAFSTLLIVDVLFSMVTRRWRWLASLVDEEPVVLVRNGILLEDRIRKERVETEDILEAARSQGLDRLDQIKAAVLERRGRISIVPVKQQGV